MDKQRARRSASIPVRIGHAAAWVAGLWKQEHLRTLITGVQRFVLCAVLAQGTILGGYMPFGLAMTAALMARGAGLSALGGLVCGVMLRGDGFHGGIYAAAALLVLCVMSVCAGLRVMSERWFAPGVATFASAACTFVFLPLGAELTAPAVLTFLLVQGITFGVCWMYGAAFAPPRDEKRLAQTSNAFGADRNRAFIAFGYQSIRRVRSRESGRAAARAGGGVSWRTGGGRGSRCRVRRGNGSQHRLRSLVHLLLWPVCARCRTVS